MQELKSSREEADKEGNLLNADGAALQNQFTVSIGRTNLPVVENLQSAMEHLGTTNANYKALLENNAESIRKLGIEFEELDKEITENISIIHKKEELWDLY